MGGNLRSRIPKEIQGFIFRNRCTLLKIQIKVFDLYFDNCNYIRKCERDEKDTETRKLEYSPLSVTQDKREVKAC